jgi:hypothetical protein
MGHDAPQDHPWWSSGDLLQGSDPHVGMEGPEQREWPMLSLRTHLTLGGGMLVLNVVFRVHCVYEGGYCPSE